MKIEAKFGTIYMEDLDDLYSYDSVEFMDTDGNYLDRWPIECFDNCTENDIVRKLKDYDTPQELLEYMSINYDLVTNNLYTLYKFMLDNNMLYSDDVQEVKDIMEGNGDLTDYIALCNEWVNHIGNYYIVISEH